MREDEQLSALIGDIYDAALEPSLWSIALGKIRAFVGGQAAVLCWKNAVTKCGCSDYQDGGLDQHYVQSYFETYVRFDPFTMGQCFAEIGEPVVTADLVPSEDLLETRFYKEWVKPQGLVDCVVCVLDRSVASSVLVGVFRHERDGVADDATRHRMRLVAPHLRRAALIGQVIDLKTSEAATFADTLDGMSASLLLVDAAGRIVHTNASGHAMLAQGCPLRATHGRLAAQEPIAEQELYEIFALAGRGEMAAGSKGVAVPLTSTNGERYVAHVLPLTSGTRRRGGIIYTAAAALFVHKAALATSSPSEVIAKTSS